MPRRQAKTWDRLAGAADIETAGRLACSVKGVAVVYNELEVEPAAR